MKRTLCWITVAYIAGILLAVRIGFELLIAPILVLLCAFLLKMLSSRIRKKQVFLLILFAFVLLGMLRFEINDNVYLKPIGKWIGKPLVFECKVIESDGVEKGKAQYVVKMSKVDINGETYRVNAKVKLTCPVKQETPVYRYGDILQVKSKLSIPSHAANEGGFDYNYYLKSQGIYAVAYASPYQIKKLNGVKHEDVLADVAFHIRQSIISIVQNYLPQEEAALLKGMLVGDRRDFTDAMKQNFSTSGLSHLVAVSGMHVAIFLMGVTYIFGLLRMHPYLMKGLCSVFVVFFIFVTGCSPSVVRAGVMAIIFLLAFMVNRDADALTSLFLSALVMLLYNPVVALHVGFQLSFCATLALLLFCSPLYHRLALFKLKLWPQGKGRREGFLAKTIIPVIAASLSAQIGTLPFVAYHFNGISLVSVVTNVLVVPLTSVVLIAGMLFCVLGSIHVLTGKLAAGFLYVILKFILAVSDIFVAFPLASIKVPSPDAWFFAAYFLVLFLLYDSFHHQTKSWHFKTALVLLCSIIMIVSISFFWNANDLEVTVLNVGQGDSILIKTHGGKAVLIDGGGIPGEDAYDVGRNVVIPHLIKRGIMAVDVAIVSHYHADHANGIISLVEDMPVGTLILPPRHKENELKQMLEKAAALREVPVYYISQGDVIQISKDVSIHVLAPRLEQIGEPAFNENDLSFVLKLNYRKIHFLFTGDIEKNAEQYIIEGKKNIQADVLKVPHHGSNTSSTKAFIEEVSPAYAVISVGRNNFGHPSQKVLQRLFDNNIEVYRTDRNGTVTFLTDGKKIKKVSVFREGE